jgi:hypothetical protein
VDAAHGNFCRYGSQPFGYLRIRFCVISEKSKCSKSLRMYVTGRRRRMNMKKHYSYLLSSDKFYADLNRAVVHLFGFAVIIAKKQKNLLLNRHGGFWVPIGSKRDTQISQWAIHISDDLFNLTHLNQIIRLIRTDNMHKCIMELAIYAICKFKNCLDISL